MIPAEQSLPLFQIFQILQNYSSYLIKDFYETPLSEASKIQAIWISRVEHLQGLTESLNPNYQHRTRALSRRRIDIFADKVRQFKYAVFLKDRFNRLAQETLFDKSYAELKTLQEIQAHLIEKECLNSPFWEELLLPALKHQDKLVKALSQKSIPGPLNLASSLARPPSQRILKEPSGANSIPPSARVPQPPFFIRQTIVPFKPCQKKTTRS